MDPSGGSTDVVEAVNRPAWDDDGVSRPGDDRTEPPPEPHRSFEDLEGLLLYGVDVGSRNLSVRLQLELEREQLAVGLSRGPPERESLATYRVFEDLS
jgi:hypothetical protein